MIKKLVLVDDDEVYVYLTRRMIQETALVDQVKVFRNGLEAINFLKSCADQPDQLPEVIFLDLSMPVMDGWQFLKEFTLLKPHTSNKITIYIVTSSISPEDLTRARAISEVSDYLIKPVRKEQFIALINGLL